MSPATGTQSRLTLPHVPGQLVVQTTSELDSAALALQLAQFGADVVGSAQTPGLELLQLGSDNDLADALVELEADSRVVFAELNYIAAESAVPNDSDFSLQWSKNNTGLNAPGGLGTPGADLNLVDAWDTQSDSPGVRLAIIDDGFETSHADLADNFLTTGRCFASPLSSRPCTLGPTNPSPADSQDTHGTLVTGAAAARGNNGVGIAGATWSVGVLPLKVDLSYWAIVQAVDEAVSQSARIINMSFGGPAYSNALDDAVGRAEAAGILVVAAAGNADGNNARAAVFPANLDRPNLLSVAASTSRDELAGFSQWGAFNVDLAAPGELIRTTTVGNSYGLASGTSFAAPHVAGVAALIHSATNSADYRQLKAHLLNGTVPGQTALGPVTPGADVEHLPGRVATGRLDANKALSMVSGGVLTIDSVRVDDALSGDDDGVLDPGETALLVVSLRNDWLDELGVQGALSVVEAPSQLSVSASIPAVFGDIRQGASQEASFQVSAADGSGNAQILLQLDLTSVASVPLPSRHFYLELGTLQAGISLQQEIQRYSWDEFQSFHVNVPAGASNLRIETTGPGDVDLLVRAEQPPDYLISLNSAADEGFYYVGAEVLVSSEAGSTESVVVPNPVAGVYHAVVVNFDQQPKTYDIVARYDGDTADTIAISSAGFSARENDNSALITVSRVAGAGTASVDYALVQQSATAGEDYTDVSGTLTWAEGESGDKTFQVALIDDSVVEETETVVIRLANATGSTLGNSSATLSILDDDTAEVDSAPPPVATSSSKGSGSLSGFELLMLLLLVALMARNRTTLIRSSRR